MKVRDVMTAEVHSCKRDATAKEALVLMWKHDVGALPILDDDGRVLGMITDRDIAMACCMRDAAPNALRVQDISAKQVFSVSADDTIESAEQIMEERQVRRVPVLEDGCVVGMVSLADLAHGGRRVPARQVAHTLKAITEPRGAPEPLPNVPSVA